MDRRRQLGILAVMALVLMRLAIGWHFYREGSSKLSYDPRTQQFDVTFSAEGFLSQAKGPLAEWFQSFVPNGHDWQKLLAEPRQEAVFSDEELAKLADWHLKYNQRREQAIDRGEMFPLVEFPPMAPYYPWAQRISDDWRAVLAKFLATPGLTESQRRKAEKAHNEWQIRLFDYFSAELPAIAEYQHDLWRLAERKKTPEAVDVPFVERRIAGQAADAQRAAQRWIAEVADFEHQYFDELRDILTSDQHTDQASAALDEESLTTDAQRRLHHLNSAVAVLTVGVGICLLIGFFTRLASLAGAVFLAAVIATQPPWVADAAPTYNQLVELAGLLVLAGTGAGRWAGLDFFSFALWRRCCGRGE